MKRFSILGFSAIGSGFSREPIGENLMNSTEFALHLKAIDGMRAKWRGIDRKAQPRRMPLRARVKQERKVARLLREATTAGKRSMMTAKHPPRVGGSTVAPDERTKVLRAAHERRIAAGWIRG